MGISASDSFILLVIRSNNRRAATGRLRSNQIAVHSNSCDLAVANLWQRSNLRSFVRTFENQVHHPAVRIEASLVPLQLPVPVTRTRVIGLRVEAVTDLDD